LELALRLLVSPAELVSYCSIFLNLQAGGIILTSTPGKTRQARPRLEPGSTLVTRINGIGEMMNRVRLPLSRQSRCLDVVKTKT